MKFSITRNPKTKILLTFGSKREIELSENEWTELYEAFEDNGKNQ